MKRIENLLNELQLSASDIENLKSEIQSYTIECIKATQDKIENNIEGMYSVDDYRGDSILVVEANSTQEAIENAKEELGDDVYNYDARMLSII